jgi:subtilisin family serine protease
LRKILAAILSALVVGAIAVPASAASNDVYFDRQWHHAIIQTEQAWATATGTGALVAVVDTGVDLQHPDLATNLVSNPDADFIEPDGTCTGGKKNGRTCVQDGAQDKNGHGTHVAGLVGAIANNGIGVAGVAPTAKILPVRVLDEAGSGTVDQIADGIRYAADKGADVINLSLGFLTGQDQAVRLLGLMEPVEAAVEYAWGKGAVIVVAAGNDSGPICAEPSGLPNVVCVGATDQFDLRSYYSNGDATLTKDFLVAPGGWSHEAFSLGENSPTGALCQGGMFSTWLRSLDVWCSPAAGYDAISGTSMAAPVVSGVAALLAGKGLSNTAIVECLKTTTDDLGVPGRDPIYGYGRVNASTAVTGC